MQQGQGRTSRRALRPPGQLCGRPCGDIRRDRGKSPGGGRRLGSSCGAREDSLGDRQGETGRRRHYHDSPDTGWAAHRFVHLTRPERPTCDKTSTRASLERLSAQQQRASETRSRVHDHFSRAHPRPGTSASLRRVVRMTRRVPEPEAGAGWRPGADRPGGERRPDPMPPPDPRLPAPVSSRPARAPPAPHG